ncbi:MAG TPA: serine hydrolase domain-containing protein [Anaerolineae bacterium]
MNSTGLATWLPQWMATAGVPGLSISLIQDGKVAWRHSFGVTNAVTQQPVTAETMFEAASLTKPVFACAILKLCESGLLDLDTPLVDYLAEQDRSQPLLFGYLANDMRLQQVTARHVLSHSSGLPNWDRVPAGKIARCHFTPGERFSYSGTGYRVLQKVVETLTGRPAAAIVQATLLQPLGLYDSRLSWTGPAEPMACGHDATGRPQEKWQWPAMSAASSLHCTPADFACFMLALLNPSSDSLFHLGTETVAEMLRPHIQVNDSAPWQADWPRAEISVEPGVYWGLGWGIQETESGRAFWHWGDNQWFKAFATGFPDAGIGAVLMANSANGDKLWRPILQEVISGRYPALDWLERVYV